MTEAKQTEAKQTETHPPGPNGTAPPAPAANAVSAQDPFTGLPDEIAQALRDRGFEALTAVQRAVADADFAGRDLRVSSQTGSGKTVAIGIILSRTLPGSPGNPVAVSAPAPLASPDSSSSAEAAAPPPFPKPSAPRKPGTPPTGPARPMAPRSSRAAQPTGLVIVPTRELANQIREELEWLFAKLPALRIESVTGGTSIGLERRALASGPALVVGTPGRLLDHLKNGAIDPARTAQVVLDEADRMLDMGFRDELEEILDLLPTPRSTHLVSATFSGGVLQLANRYQKEVLALEGTRLGVANRDIEHVAHTIRRHESYAALVNILLMGGDSRCLVFVNRRVDAMALADKLTGDGFDAAPLSGELPQSQRTRTLDAFRSGATKILVSTDVAARGIDVPEIGSVIHADPPRNADDYTHRSGRTARGGKTGRSVLLVLGPEARRVERMLRSARVEVSWQPVPSPDQVRKVLKKAGRRELHERFAANPEPSETQRAYAKTLLADRDPETLVAMLLELAISKPKIEPIEVQGLDPFADRGRGRGAGSQRLGGQPQGRPGGRTARPTRYTEFQINWGDKGGATAKRLLSHICRRGNLTSQQVGAIRIAAKSSTVDIASDVAGEFESKTRRPDHRDPEVVIRRAEGGAPSGPRHASGPRAAGKGPARGPAKGPGGSGPKGGGKRFAGKGGRGGPRKGPRGRA